MSTSQRSDRSSSNGKSNGRVSSLRRKHRVGTPGRPTGRGVEFEAAVLEAASPTAPHARGGAGSGGSDAKATTGMKGNGPESEGMDTFSYEDVSNLATVTPVVPKRAVSRVGGEAEKQQRQQAQEEEPRPAKGKKRAAERQGQAEASTEEENGSRAAKRRKQRQQEAAAAAVATATASAPSKSDATSTTPNRGTATPTRSKENTHARSDSNGGANGGARAAPAAPAALGGVTGVAPQEATAAGAGGGGNTDESRGALSPKQQQEQKAGSKSRSGQQRKGKGKAGDDKRGGRATKSVRKVPPYPRLAFEGPRGEVRSIADALGVAVTAEVQSLLRKRGKEPECKVAVETCLEAGKEAVRRTAEICDGLVSKPRGDIKVVRRIFSELRQRILAHIAEEEGLWAIEEQKCMALAESNKRAKAKVQAFDERRSRGHVGSLAGGDELRALLGPMGEEEEEEGGEEGPGSLSDTTDIAKRVADQVLAMTNDMLANVSAIGSLLQEMGAGVADAQETKERLAQVFGKVAFKNYPNVHDPKAGIAAMLK